MSADYYTSNTVSIQTKTCKCRKVAVGSSLPSQISVYTRKDCPDCFGTGYVITSAATSKEAQTQ